MKSTLHVPTGQRFPNVHVAARVLNLTVNDVILDRVNFQQIKTPNDYAIKCNDTGEIWSNYKIASRSIGVPMTTMLAAISRGTTIKGSTFSYAIDPAAPIAKPCREAGQPFRCDQTGQVFNKLTEAALALGVSQPSLTKVLSGTQSAVKGFTFTLLPKPIVEKPVHVVNNRSKPVVCVETKRWFPSVGAAAKFAKVKQPEMSRHLTGKTIRLRGLTYKYYREEKPVRLVCDQNGAVFEYESDVANFANVTLSAVRAHLEGHSDLIGGYSFSPRIKKVFYSVEYRDDTYWLNGKPVDDVAAQMPHGTKATMRELAQYAKETGKTVKAQYIHGMLRVVRDENDLFGDIGQ